MKEYILVSCKNNEIGQPIFFSTEAEAYHQMMLEMSIVLFCSIDEIERLAAGDNTYLEDCSIGYNYDEERYEGKCKAGPHRYFWVIIEHTFAG